MPVSKAQIKATTKYETANYDKVLLRLPKGQKDKIKTHAEKRGESINGFVGRAISETMQRDALELSGAVQADPDTESKQPALLEKLPSAGRRDQETEKARAAVLEKLRNAPAGKGGEK